MNRKFNFVYITTNLINGKQYIGDHSTDKLNDSYLGSGKGALTSAFKKYGKKNFKREILEFFPTKQEAFDAQEKYINQFNTLSPNGYNIHPKGGSKMGFCSEETRKKLSIKLSGRISPMKGRKHSEDTKNKMSESQKGKIQTEETKKLISEKNKGHKVSDETKKIWSEKRKGRPSPMKGNYHSEESKKMISKSKKGHIAYNKGVKTSESIKQKISISLLGHKQSEITKQKKSEAMKKRWAEKRIK